MTVAPDLAVLDVSMPGLDGKAVLRIARKRKDPPAIVFMSAHWLPSERAEGLELGADDYVVKPFDMRELIARVRAVLARRG